MSTPGRPSSGIPTPASRRPRSSLGPGHPRPDDDDAMDRALQDVLRTRPPSSLRNHDDAPFESSSHLSASYGLPAPRTPGVSRQRTPSALGGAPVTPSAASRSVSRAGLGLRSSLANSTTAPFTPRRTSMASSTTSTTPFARRPESRASERDPGTSKWVPVVGERVRISSMGYEGTLRFYGATEFKEGVWAGVELEGGFKGKGKNDGNVGGVQYFSCPPNCGIFVTAVKLSQPTTGASRPSSVASSHRSQASYTLSGRATPSMSGRATPSRPPSVTPGRVPRTVSSAARSRPSISGHLDDDLPSRTALGNSTSANTLDSRFTVGSRASKYAGMTAKQLDTARAGSASKLGQSTSTVTGTTPKVSRISMGLGTPARGPRQSVSNLVTPRARAPRSSGLHDMPPPPSPGNINRVLTARQVEALEEEIRELKRRNGELEEDLKQAPELKEEREDDGEEVEELRGEAEKAKADVAFLRSQLETAETNANDAVRILEELQGEHTAQQEDIDQKAKELQDLRKELKLAAERAEEELSAGMEAKKEQVREMLERAESAELELSEMKALVDELTNAGQQMISLNETKQYELEERLRELEDKNRSLDEKLQKAREEQEKSLLPPSPSTRQREAATAAEIDNETLNAQVKHLQSKLNHLEEEVDEARAQAETDAEAWKNKINRVKESEKAVREEGGVLRTEIKELKEQANGARGKIGELEGALKENQVALEGARAEIESLRVEASEAAGMRAALQSASANEKALTAAQAEVAELKKTLQAAIESSSKAAADAEGQVGDLEAKIASLEAEIETLKKTAESNISNNLPTPPTKLSSSSSSSEDTEKKIRGFQHIIQDLSAENADLKEQCESLREEVALMKEEVKLLEETAGDLPSGGAGNQKELLEAKTTIKELNREVAELETLIETKIYREDELETRVSSLEREVDRHRKSSASSDRPPHSATSTHFSHGSDNSHSSSTATGGSNREVERCELCEGPHDLDACPVFAGNVTGEEKKGGKWCEDCESSEHDTVECPMAEDVF
ncbi:hypothetical protein L198_05369 [Cryptococcus wingfieldii CBS 7118]|uniref:CAP-Gly domain-containing protein n=1 Tax=Cryptococcus wingfieldii CBS 7118 TaxID=1295528 RepID=A0A1E3IY28_9TREE|nr:hypothetical protein L198_05369 [Cryptococcus wingfieldii CBS 7118]ODN93504.1 hypothetical protein L198_05369 [Cryptococcus wingfieldii CBS 7118]